MALWIIFGLWSLYSFTTWPANDTFYPAQGVNQQIAAKGLQMTKMADVNILDAGTNLTIFSDPAEFVRQLQSGRVLYTIEVTTSSGSRGATSEITVKYCQFQANQIIEFDQSQQYETLNTAYGLERASLQKVEYGKNVVIGVIEVGVFTLIFAILEGAFIWLCEWLWDATDGIRNFVRNYK